MRNSSWGLRREDCLNSVQRQKNIRIQWLIMRTSNLIYVGLYISMHYNLLNQLQTRNNNNF